MQCDGKMRQYVQWCLDNCKNTKVSCRKFPPSTVEIAVIVLFIVVVTKKPHMCQIMRLSLYCMNGSIQGRRVNKKNSQVCNSDFISISVLFGVFLIDASALYRPIYAIKWETHNLTHRRFFHDNDVMFLQLVFANFIFSHLADFSL